MIIISSYTDIQTYVANEHGDFAEHGLDVALADAIQAADHPDYDRDWQDWLEINMAVLRDRVSAASES